MTTSTLTKGPLSNGGRLRIGGALKITLASIPAAFGTVLGTAYMGSGGSSDAQGGATFN